MTKADDKPTILWVSDSWNFPTGFGQQTEYITQELVKRGYKLHLIGHQSSGIRMTDQFGRELISGMGSKFSEAAFDINVRRIKPDIVFCLTDWWNTSYIGYKLRPNDYAWIQWLPMDGEPYAGSNKWNDSFLAADAIIMLAKYGYNQMAESMEYSKKEDDVRVFPTLDWIHHGVEIDIFKPFSIAKKRELREEYKISEEAVVYLCVGRNQPRKNYPNLFLAWANFIEKNQLTEDEAVLWIHALKRDAGWDFDFLIHQLYDHPNKPKLNKEEFKKTIKFTSDLFSLNESMSPQDLAGIYNLADWFVLPTTGEGFGIPTIEAMACGVPVIITDCTTSPELLNYGNNGFLVPWQTRETDKGNVDRFRISVPELTRIIDYTYSDIRLRNSMETKLKGANALEWARKNVSFDTIIEKMDKFFTEFWQKWKTRTIVEKEKFGDEFDAQYIKTQLRNRAGEFAKLERKTFLGVLPKPLIHTMLDVGCGSGEDMLYFNREGINTIGCDIADAAIVYCRERGFSVEWANILELNKSFKKHQFDATWASHVLEHVKDWKKGIKQMWRISKHVIGLCIPYDNMRDSSHIRPYKEEEMEEVCDYIRSLPDCEDVYMTKIWSSHSPCVSHLIVGYKNVTKSL